MKKLLDFPKRTQKDMILLNVIQGFGKYLDLPYGIRTEADISKGYHNMPSFGKIEEFLDEDSFRLDNLDCDEEGSP